MAKEYISRDVALAFPFANGQYDRENADPHFINGCESYREWLETIPAADVVEVVRCKECRFAPSGSDDSVEQGFGLKWPEDNWPYQTNPCPYRCDDDYYSQKPEPDFFCAAGKRKDGGQEPPKEEA